MEQITTQSEEIKSFIVAANKKFMEIFNNGATGIADIYTNDAELYPPNGDVIKGNVAIEPMWKGTFDAGIQNINMETVTAEPAGDKVIETGQYNLSGADGTRIDSGKYILIWKKENGDWKLYQGIWNTSLPA